MSSSWTIIANAAVRYVCLFIYYCCVRLRKRFVSGILAGCCFGVRLPPPISCHPHACGAPSPWFQLRAMKEGPRVEAPVLTSRLLAVSSAQPLRRGSACHREQPAPHEAGWMRRGLRVRQQQWRLSLLAIVQGPQSTSCLFSAEGTKSSVDSETATKIAGRTSPSHPEICYGLEMRMPTAPACPPSFVKDALAGAAAGTHAVPRKACRGGSANLQHRSAHPAGAATPHVRPCHLTLELRAAGGACRGVRVVRGFHGASGSQPGITRLKCGYLRLFYN